MVEFFDLKTHLLEKIKDAGGWTNAHAHIDRAFTITKENFYLGSIDFQKKWELNQKISNESSQLEIYDRMAKSIEVMLSQGVTAMGTFIDVHPGVNDRAIKAASKIKDKYGKDIELKFINQTLYGVLEPEARRWFDEAAEFVDIIGGLPSKDKGREEEHLDVIMDTAKQKGKMVHVHVDQLNDADEKETELLIEKTLKHDMQGKVVAIHAISLAAKPKAYRNKIYRQMARAGVMVVANPSAYIDDRRKEQLVPFHNSITPVDEMVPMGIVVGLGTDNIADLHKPFTDGEMWIELRILLEACRYFEIDELVKIATVNGRKVLGLPVKEGE